MSQQKLVMEYLYFHYIDKNASVTQIREVLPTSLEGEKEDALKYIKPVASINLKEVASAEEIRNSLSRILSKSNLSEDIVFSGVIDRVRILIANGILDGIIDSSGMYTSNASLSRKSVQYQVAIDFTGLFTQLKGKGIVLESLECPSCKGTLQYPESGSIVSCTFCGATVSAIDVFDKFKGLLDV